MTLEEIYEEFKAGSPGFVKAVQTHCGFNISNSEIESLAKECPDWRSFLDAWENGYVPMPERIWDHGDHLLRDMKFDITRHDTKVTVTSRDSGDGKAVIKVEVDEFQIEFSVSPDDAMLIGNSIVATGRKVAERIDIKVDR